MSSFDRNNPAVNPTSFAHAMPRRPYGRIQSHRRGAHNATETANRRAVTRGHSNRGSRRQKRPFFMQHLLKAPPGAARAEVLAAELLDQFLATMYDAHPVLDMLL